MPRPQKSIRKLGADKVLATFIWDNNEILFIVYMQNGISLNRVVLHQNIRRIDRKNKEKETEVERRRNFTFFTKTHTKNFKNFYRGKEQGWIHQTQPPAV
jgi:hypothetical protein